MWTFSSQLYKLNMAEHSKNIVLPSSLAVRVIHNQEQFGVTGDSQVRQYCCLRSCLYTYV